MLLRTLFGCGNGVTASALAIGSLLVVSAAGGEPLHVRIDQQFAASAVVPTAELISDEEFARRIYLDLTGAVPSPSELRPWLADTSPNKRAELVDRLLLSPAYARHLATTFDVMLNERRADKHVKREVWLKYLYDSFDANKRWNQLASELLGADGSDEKIGPAAKFYLDREVEPNLLTRDVGRVFFGMDLSCCQCHDHPLVDSYQQYDYYGIYAFFSRGSLFTNKDKKVFFAEKAEGDVKFTSVFTKQQDEMRPRLPGDGELAEPVFVKGEEYTVAPADNVRPVPKYSRLSRLAELVATGTNRQFNRNIANRLWAIMMGRGLVEPLDMHHVDNPPAQPELLEMLADEFAGMKFDVRGFLREIALSQAYQRSHRRPESLADAIQRAAQDQPRLEVDTQQRSEQLEQTLAAFDKMRVDYDAARKEVTTVLAEFSAANEAIAAALKAAQDAGKALTEAQQQWAAKKELHAAVQDAAAKATAAASQLAEEKTLAQAAETFQKRAAQLASELPAAQKLVQDRSPPAASANEKLTAARHAAGPIVEKLHAAQQRADRVQAALSETSEKLRYQRVAAQSAQARLAATKSLAETAAALNLATESRKRHTELNAQWQQGKQTLANLISQLPQLEATLAATQSAQSDLASQLSAAQTELAGRQQAVQLLAETAAKAEVVVQKLPKDAELKQVADALKTRRDQLMAEVPALQKVADRRAEETKAATEQLSGAQLAVNNARAQLELLQKSLPDLESQRKEALEKAQRDEAAAQLALNRADDVAVRQFLVSGLEPLTPEQLAWSIMKVTGVVDQQLAAAEADVNKTLPVDPQSPPDAAKAAERARRIEQFVYDKLQSQVTTFVRLFGHAGGQPQRDFFATADQALFFANGSVLQSWLNPSGDNLIGRLAKLENPRDVAEQLYLSVLIRRPADEEVAAVTQYLAGRTGDRVLALQEMAWALVTSNEFRFQ